MEIESKTLKEIEEKQIYLTKMHFEITEEEYQKIREILGEDNYTIWYLLKSPSDKINFLDKYIRLIEKIKATRIL